MRVSMRTMRWHRRGRGTKPTGWLVLHSDALFRPDDELHPNLGSRASTTPAFDPISDVLRESFFVNETLTTILLLL